MAISFVGGTTGTGTGASYTVSLSGTLTGGSGSSPVIGDLIVVFAGHGNTASSPPSVSGDASGVYVGAHAAINQNDSWDTQFCTFYQVAGATPDATLTVTRTNNTTYGGACVVLVLRGAGAVTATTAGGGNGAAVDPPSVTPTVAGSWVLAGGTGLLAAAQTAGMTAISNLTAVFSAYGDGSTADASTIAGYYSGWTSGAFDPATATGGTLNNASSSWAGASLVIAPGPAPFTDFTEDWGGGTINAGKWAESNSANTSQAVTTGALHQTVSSSAQGWASIQSVDSFNLVGSHIYVKLVQALQQASSGAETTFRANNSAGSGGLSFVIASSGAIEAAYINASGAYTWVAGGTYSATTHAWFRYKEADVAGTRTVYWQTAPSTASNPPQESDWVTYHSMATSGLGWTPYSVKVQVYAGNNSALATAPTGPAIWDGFNIATTAAASVALTGQSVTIARGTLVPATSAALTGQSVTTSRGTPATARTVVLTGQSITASRGTLTGAAARPKLETFTADFESALSSGVWSTSDSANASTTTASGRLSLAVSSTAQGWASVDSASTYDLRDSHAHVRLVQPLQQAAAEAETVFRVSASTTRGLSFVVQNGGIWEAGYFDATDAYVWTAGGTYSATTHAWLRFKESDVAGTRTVSWQTAPSSASDPPQESDWTTRASVATTALGWTPNEVFVHFHAGNNVLATSTPTGPALFDALNTSTSGGVVALTGQSVTTSRGTVSVSGVPVSVALTGRSATVSRGTLSASSSQRIQWGVNVHTGGTSTAENTQIADMLAYRNLHHKVRFDMYYNNSSTLKARIRDLIEKLNARGGSAVLIIFTRYQDDHDPVGKVLPTVYSNAYNDAYGIVNEFSDIVTDFELHNETSLRSEVIADAPFNDQQESTTNYEASDAAAYVKAFMRGVSNAIAQVAVDTGRPLRRIFGFTGRDWSWGTYMQQTGTPAASPGAVGWEVTGWHIYPHEFHRVLSQETWWAEAAGMSPLQRMALFGKPVTINEFNCGELYDGSTYANVEGDAETEAGFAAVNKNAKDLYTQTQCNLESVTYYELFDRPSLAPTAEARAGLIYGETPSATPKTAFYVAAAYAGGYLTTAERAEITTERTFLTNGEIDAMQVHKSAALTGQQSTATKGTLVPGGVVSGHSLAASRGALGVVAAAGLTGLATAVSGGSISPVPGFEAQIAGQSLSAALGSVATSVTSPDQTVALTGHDASVSAGAVSIVVEYTVGLTGRSATVATQPLEAVHVEVEPAGEHIASNAGTLVPQAQIPLTGQATTTARGSVGRAIDKPLTGLEAVVAVDDLQPGSNTLFTLSTNGLQAAAGALTPSTVCALTGAGASVSRGTLTALRILTVPLSGLALSAARGELDLEGSSPTVDGPPPPFLSIEARINRAVFARLANADAVIAGSLVRGIFENAYAHGDVGVAGMSGTQPVFTMPTASISGEPVGQTVAVNSQTYLVAAHEPDGTGVSRLILERA